MFPSLFSSIGGGTLVFLEVLGLIFGILAIIGLGMLMYRRFTNPRVLIVTNKMDMVIEALLLIQFIIGVTIAIGSRWGLSWYASDMVPYLYSIFSFSPDIKAVSALPTLVQTHIVLGFAIILLVPFSRLVHFLGCTISLYLQPISSG